MPKPIKHTRPKDVNQLAHRLVGLSTADEAGDIKPPTQAQISLVMAQLGRKGGKIGGKRRLETMSEAARKKTASNAAKARWAKRNT